jgi:hypothetical protein
MTFPIIFSITFILIISFGVTKKKLHLFEILFMWMIINLIHHNFLTVTAVNLQMFDFAEYPANYWTLVLMRVFLIPMLIIWYFDQTLSEKIYIKWAWLPAFILLLTGVEYLADILNVYRHSHWKLWWSFIEWFLIFLLVNFTWAWFRKLLIKEME